MRYRYNQDFRSLDAMVPAVISLLLLFVPSILTALAVVREKELGSITNFYVTPVTRLEFLLGKQLPYVAVAMLSFVVLVALAVTLFGVALKGSLSALAVGALLYVATARAWYAAAGLVLFVGGSALLYNAVGRVQERVSVWIDPWSHADTTGYQITQSLYSIGNGGFSGKGWGNGVFPDRSAHGNAEYLPWLLDQLHAREAATGQRVLDVFTVHYYPQGGEFSNDVSQAPCSRSRPALAAALRRMMRVGNTSGSTSTSGSSTVTS